MPRVDHDWFLPILQFAVPFIFLGYLAFCIRTGEIYVRRIAVYRKDTEPAMFWFYAGMLLAVGLILLVGGIYRVFSS